MCIISTKNLNDLITEIYSELPKVYQKYLGSIYCLILIIQSNNLFL